MLLHSFKKALSLLSLLLPIVCLSFVQGEHSINDFSLKNIDGKRVALNDYKDAKGFVIVFTCNHCPFAKLYPARLNALTDKYAALNVPLIAINSIDTSIFDEDRYANMVTNAKLNRAHYPYLYDSSQAVARNFGADKTPHAFVLWKENGLWVVKYNGAIDDNGAEPDKVTHKYIEEAIDALLLNQPVKIKQTKCIGCRIKLRA